MRTVFASAFCALLAPTFAGAQSMSAENPVSIVDALQELGYRARLVADAEGDPLIESSVDGSDYSLIFYGCRENRSCKYVMFSAGFDLPDGVTFSKINAWNREKLVGRAYVDEENDPFLDFFVTMEGGLSRENFLDAFDWWRLSVSDFKDHVGW